MRSDCKPAMPDDAAWQQRPERSVDASKRMPNDGSRLCRSRGRLNLDSARTRSDCLALVTMHDSSISPQPMSRRARSPSRSLRAVAALDCRGRTRLRPAAGAARSRTRRSFPPSTSSRRWAGRTAQTPVAADGHDGRRRSRASSIIRAGCTCCPTATCSSPRPTRRRGPDDSKGIKGWFFKRYQKKAGGAVPSANRITLLRDADGDGVAETAHGVPAGSELAVRHGAGRRRRSTSPTPTPSCASRTRRATRRSRRAPTQGARSAGRPAQPSLDQEHHRQPRRHEALRRRRLEQQRRRERHGRGGGPRRDLGDRSARPARIASSPPACAIRSAWRGSRRRGALWMAVNERDELGNDLVPDYMTSVQDGGFYGWPYSYYGQHVDERVKPPRPDLVATAIVPDYALGAAHGVARPGVRRRQRAAAALRAAACSSASTARGTASRAAATR